MQTLIDDLLSYSTNTMQGETFAWVDLNTTMEEAKCNCQEILEESRATLDVGPLPVQWGISFQLRQLFENLLSNAVKYRDPDRAPVVRINCEKIRHITVGENSGDNAEKMFDIFQRLHSRSVIPGTGIGLAICKKVVQNHSGFIYGTGEPGEGSVFTVYLPAGKGSTDGSA